jgi:hypothetical protein
MASGISALVKRKKNIVGTENPRGTMGLPGYLEVSLCGRNIADLLRQPEDEDGAPALGPPASIVAD